MAAMLVCYGEGSRFQELYKISIDEAGTRFNETVEINGKENSVVYKVPEHNNVAQSETCFDYKTGYFATRIPKLKECYIQRIPKGQSSLRYVRNYLQQYRVFERSNPTVPVKITATAVIKEQRIDLKKFSSSLSAFCGDFVAYKGRQVYHRNLFQVQQNETKGKGVRRNVHVPSIKLATALLAKIEVELPDGDKWKKITFNKCEKLSYYMPDLIKGGCDENSDDWEYHCHAKTETCMYTVRCKLVSTDNDIQQRIRCQEKHIFTGWTCCDVKCRT
mgnify:CR=1 FL=1